MIIDSTDSSEKYKSIYSILFGLGITYFLTHALKYWAFVTGPEGITWNLNIVLFVVIQLYFFMNYFRYLFGLRRFAEMTGQNFIPKEADWLDKSQNTFLLSVKNFSKIIIVNVGIVQLLIFFVISFIIIPEVNIGLTSPSIYKYLDTNLVNIYVWFFKLDILLLVIDLLAVLGFKYLDSKMGDLEKREANIWVTSNFAEILCCALALLVLRNGSNSDYFMALVFISIKFLLLVAELLGCFYLVKRVNMINNTRSENA